MNQRTRAGLSGLIAQLILTCSLFASASLASAQLIDGFENSANYRRPWMSLSAGVITSGSTTTGVTQGTTAMAVDFGPSATSSLSVQLNLEAIVNLAGTSGLAVDVTNPTSGPLGIGIMIRDEQLDAASQYFQLAPGATATLLLRLDTWGVDFLSLYGMRALPSPLPTAIVGQPTFVAAVDLSRTWRISFFMRGGRTTTDRLIFDNLRVIPSVGGIPGLLTGMTDQFGQYSAVTWPGKLSSVSQIAARWTSEQAEQASIPSLPDRDEYGAWLHSPNYGATGYFRKQKINGKWWLIAPNGRKFFSTGISRIRPDAEFTMATGREYMFQYLPPLTGHPDSKHYTAYTTSIGPTPSGNAFNFHRLNMERKFGANYDTEERNNLARRLRSWGFNTMGRGVSSSYYRRGVPYVGQIVETGTYPTIVVQPGVDSPVADPYAAAFRTMVDTNVKRMLFTVPIDDPYMVGMVFGAEPPFRGRTTGSEYALTYAVARLTEASSAAKAAFVSQLRAKYPTIANLNASWGTTYSSWTTVSNSLTLPATPTAGLLADMSVQVRNFVSTYHRVLKEEIAESYPNHMFLGVSIHLFSDEINQGSSDWVDVHTFNYYRPRIDGQFDWLATRDLPAIISEFHFGSMDRGGLSPGIQGVARQEDRATSLTNYVQSALDHPNFVGAWWFQYVDCPITGWFDDGINYAAGFVDITDTPYPELVAAARAVNGEVYNRRN